MGAPTSNRKRGGYFFSLKNLSSPSSPLDSESSGGLHVAKKPKLLSLPPMNPNPERQSSLQSTFRRVGQYPQPQPLKREVHAPRSSFKSSGKMGVGGMLYQKLVKAKTKAFATFRHVGKEKEVVDVDKECSNSKGLVFDDEEVQILDDKKSGGIAQKSIETKEDAFLRERYQSFDDVGLGGSSSLVSDLSNQTPRDDDCTIISVSREVELTEPPHKRLYKEAGSRDSKLCHLDFLIAFTSKKLPIKKLAKSPKQDLLKEAFVELTDDEEDEVSKALSNTSRRKLLVTHADSNIEITGEVLQCLGPRAWLNDEVINLYLELLKEREKREPQKFLKCHFFNTFFYKKLVSGKGGYDFKAVRRWTTQRKIGYALIDCDKIFVPIHKEIHWCLAIINKKDKKFQYLDSLKGKDPRVLQVLAKYYVDEVKDKSAKDIDVSSWEQEYVLDLPAQENGFDCGMFMIKYADFYSRGLGLAFRQMHMPYFRKRTTKEILRLKAE